MCMLALTYCTFVIIHSSITVFMQQLLHAAECDGGEVAGVFQLEEALQVGRCLTPSHVHTLTVHRIQPRIKTHIEIRLYSMNCKKNKQRKVCVVCDSSPAVDDRQDVRAVVSRGQNDASVWRLEVPLSVIVVETVQAVHAIGDIRDVIALEQQL